MRIPYSVFHFDKSPVYTGVFTDPDVSLVRDVLQSISSMVRIPSLAELTSQYCVVAHNLLEIAAKFFFQIITLNRKYILDKIESLRLEYL